MLAGYDGTDFTYEEQYLAGAVFEVYAAENIYTADFQKDESGNRILEYAEGTLVTTITTDASGLATAKNLPLGKYLVKEKNAPEGFVLNAASQEVSFEYSDQNTAVITQSVSKAEKAAEKAVKKNKGQEL